MDIKTKQHWSEDETSCLLALWCSAEVQQKLDGATRTKPVFAEIQKEMAVAGFDRSIEQICNKLKKLKKEYRDRKKDPGRSGYVRSRKGPHFELLDSVLGERPVGQVNGALNSATAAAVTTNESLQRISDLSGVVDDDTELVQLASSPPLSPACSSAASSPASPQQTRQRKRKREGNVDLLEYLERSDERFLQHSKDLNDALLQRMEADTNALLGLMGRMVSVIEAQSRNKL